MLALGAPAGAQSPTTTTPIEHLIVVVGENLSFDNLFGTYQPKSGAAVRNLLASHATSGVRYWSGGEINLKALNEMMRAQKIVGALKDDPDWSKIIDEQFLPDDLKKKTQ